MQFVIAVEFAFEEQGIDIMLEFAAAVAAQKREKFKNF